MNTKSLLLAAVVAAVGAVTGAAQVTSQNIVGYIRLSLNPGFNLVANQLNNGNNTVATVPAKKEPRAAVASALPACPFRAIW